MYWTVLKKIEVLSISTEHYFILLPYICEENIELNYIHLIQI